MAESLEDLIMGYRGGIVGWPTTCHNHTNPGRYHPEAAKDAWNRNLKFFKKNLQG